MKESLEDYTRVMRGRYARRTGKPARQKLLDEYCQTTGLERKYANKVLRGQRRRDPSGVPRGASSRYTKSDLEVLKSVWLAAGRPELEASATQASARLIRKTSARGETRAWFRFTSFSLPGARRSGGGCSKSTRARCCCVARRSARTGDAHCQKRLADCTGIPKIGAGPRRVYSCAAAQRTASAMVG
jgi:hypothetical protein